MNVLIVDDSESVRKMLRVMLADEGISTVEAADGLEALELLDRQPVDAVISDLLMPNMDGYRLCYELRRLEKYRNLPMLIYTSTYISSEDERVALELGANKFLRKPASPQTLLQTLREITTGAGRPRPVAGELPQELEKMKEYSEELIKKLEQKNLELERSDAEQKRQATQVRENANALRALSARLQSVREEERTRIAREIHDVLGQLLTALKLDVRWLEKRAAGLSDTALRAGFVEKAQSAGRLIDETVEAVQKIAMELRPTILDHLGLAAAIQCEAQEFQKRSGVRCEVALPAQRLSLKAEFNTALFRIFQEILTNVARHAEASQVDIALEQTGGWLELRVRDNGKGISEQQAGDSQALGLLGMRERALTVGGELLIQGVAGKGTTVTAKVPVQ